MTPSEWEHQRLLVLHHFSDELGLSIGRCTDLFVNPEYKVYKIRQGKRGKLRNIEEPVEDLKRIQRAMIPLFEEVYRFSPACTARKGFSAPRNAALHRHAKHLLKVDIKNCYLTTAALQVFRGFGLAEKYLSSEVYKFLQTMIWYGMYGNPRSASKILPTGAPTSPLLCNIALTPVDFLVESYLQKEYGDKYTYTRYLDDLIISTTHDKRDWNILHKIESIIMRGGWTINKKKSKWYTSNESDKPVVTGVRVGDSYGVPREFHRKVRARLQNLAMEGREIDAETQGCLAYIKSVDLGRYNQLILYYDRRKDYVSPERERTDSQ